MNVPFSQVEKIPPSIELVRDDFFRYIERISEETGVEIDPEEAWIELQKGMAE